MLLGDVFLKALLSKCHELSFVHLINSFIKFKVLGSKQFMGILFINLSHSISYKVQLKLVS